MNFEYYYGTQADQFSFIRIPRILLLDEAFSALSLSAKVLYSVLLDRMGLSMKNKWLPTLEKCEHKNSFINILLYKFRLVDILSHRYIGRKDWHVRGRDLMEPTWINEIIHTEKRIDGL